MRRCLTLAIRPGFPCAELLRAWVECSIRPQREYRDIATDVIGYEQHSPLRSSSRSKAHHLQTAARSVG